MAAAEDQEKDLAQELLRAAQDGDDSARGRLLDRYRAYLSAIAEAELAGDLRPKAGASDVVQDTLLEAHRCFARFEGAEGDEFRAWLRGILLNKLAQLHRHFHEVQKREIGREQSLEESGQYGALRNKVVGSDSTPSGRAAQDEDEHRVKEALARLPETVRQVIVWRNWENLPFAEIGRRLGRSEDAARMFYTTALERFATELGDPGVDQGPE
jgi:RNA polymerase sigma-70 factor (ECF subfamily)